MFYQYLVFCILLILTSCSTAPSGSTTDSYPIIDTPELREKSRLFPDFDVIIRILRNYSIVKSFPSNQKSDILTILSLIKFVVNTPEFKTAILSKTFISTDNRNGRLVNATIKVGDSLDSAKILTLIEKVILSTEIQQYDLAHPIVGCGTVPNVSLYLDYQNSPNFDNLLQQISVGNFIRFTSAYNISLHSGAVAEIGNTIIHELMHNMGFGHHASVPIEKDVAYIVGDTFEAMMKNPDFFNKYRNRFNELVPFYEIRHSPLLTASRTEVQPLEHHSLTHSDDGSLTLIQCIIHGKEEFLKPFRYLFKDGQKTADRMILK